MANCNKVVIDGVTKIDLTGDSVTAADVAEGKTFHDASGTQKTGTKAEPKLQSKSVTITSNGTINIVPDSGYDALSEANVTVNVSGSGVKTCSVNIYFGEYISSDYFLMYNQIDAQGNANSCYLTVAGGRYEIYQDISSLVCDSLLVICSKNNREVYTEGADYIGRISYNGTYMYIFNMPSTQGANGYIEFYDE